MNQKIVIGFDGSSGSQAALTWALNEAHRTGVAAELVYADEWPVWQAAASMVPSPALRPESYVDEVIDGMLERAVTAAHRSHPDVPVSATTVRALASTALASRSDRAGMIVLGTRDHTALAGMLGSVGASVGAHAHCPVVVVHGRVAGSGPVIAAVDGSPLTPAVLRFAAAQAAGHRAVLRVVHLQEGAGNHLTAVREEFAGLRIEADEVPGSPMDALVDAGAKARLLVVGSRGHGAVRGLFLGSASRHALRHAACPVAIVHDLRQTAA